MLATQATHRALRRPPGLHKHTKAQPSSRSRRIGGHFRQITKPLLSVVRKRAAYASSSRLHLHSLPYARARASSLLHCQPNQSALAAPPLPPPYPAPQVLQASSERAASRAMLQASSERAAPLPGAPRLWVPGMSTDAGPTTARAREITLRREEMLGMLRDLPEADYELSLTDLVDKTSAGAGVVSPPPPPASERKEASPCPSPRSLGPADQQQPTKAEKKGSSARRRSEGGSGSGSSFRSSSDGVLLNFYMPRSFTRSFTAPRPGRTPSASSSGRAASVAVVPEDCNKRERDGDAVRCWPLPWDRRWRKSSRRRQDPAATSGELTAILTAADHTAPADKA